MEILAAIYHSVRGLQQEARDLHPVLPQWDMSARAAMDTTTAKDAIAVAMTGSRTAKSSLMVAVGHGFESRRELNTVTVGGSKALVVTAERHRLVVICSFHVRSSPVCVKINDGGATQQ